MTYFLAGQDRTNLARYDGTDWWITDESGTWVKMTVGVKAWLQDGGELFLVSEQGAAEAFAEFFPKAIWSP